MAEAILSLALFASLSSIGLGELDELLTEGYFNRCQANSFDGYEMSLSFSLCDMAIKRDLTNDTIVMFDWTTSVVTDRSEEIAIRCQCGKDILGQIGNGTIISELCGPKMICDSLCMYGGKDCSIAQCHEGDALYNVCIFQTLLSSPELVTIIIHGIACNSIIEVASTCDDSVVPSSDSNSTTSTRVRNLAIFSSIIVIVMLMLAVVIGCTITFCKLKTKIRRQEKEVSTLRENSIRYTSTNAPHYDHLESKFHAEQMESYKDMFKTVMVPYTSINMGEEIGAGAFGKVHKGVLVTDIDGSLNETTVAIKLLRDNPSSAEIHEFISESVIMLDFDHPNVLSLLGVCFDTEQDLPLIILPYMANGDLKSYLLDCRGDNEPNTLPDGLSLDILKSMCLDVARGMEYLISLKFIHRDLAARNCMVNKDLTVKVADFGFSRDIYNIDYYRLERKTRLPVKWLPPECLLDNKFDAKTDVWSFGIVCWEIFSLGRAPYPGVDNADIPEYIIAGNRLKQPSLCPKSMYCVISSCWHMKSDERPTFSDLVTSLESLQFTQTDTETDKHVYFVLEA